MMRLMQPIMTRKPHSRKAVACGGRGGHRSGKDAALERLLAPDAKLGSQAPPPA